MRRSMWFLSAGLLLAGCGGGSGSLIGGTTPLAPDFSRDAGVTARIEVDPTTNTAQVTNLGPEGRAIWQGNSVKVESAEVFQLPGSSVSSRVLRLKFKNTTRIPLGLNEPLTASLSTAASDFSAMTEAGIGPNSFTDGAVASASIGTPRAVWEDTDGTTNSTDGQPGQTTFPLSLASDDAGTIYFTDNGALRAFRNGRIYTVNINVGGGLTDGYTDGGGQQSAAYIAVNKRTGTVYSLSGTPVTRLLSFEAVVP